MRARSEQGSTERLRSNYVPSSRPCTSRKHGQNFSHWPSAMSGSPTSWTAKALSRHRGNLAQKEGRPLSPEPPGHERTRFSSEIRQRLARPVELGNAVNAGELTPRTGLALRSAGLERPIAEITERR